MKPEIIARAKSLSPKLEAWLKCADDSEELSAEVVLALLADTAGNWLGKCYADRFPEAMEIFHEWVTAAANYHRFYDDHDPMTVYRGPLPFPGHRTMEEVAETEELKEIKASRRVTGGRARRLDQLLDMEELNNPPINPTEPNNAT